MAQRRRHRIGYFAFDGMQALDLFGPLEAFQEANELTGAKRAVYENIIISPDGAAVLSSSGVSISAHASLENCPPLDTLIIPGGAGARATAFSSAVISWLKKRAARVRRVGSICTGLFILAQTGMLNGRQVTTHWRHADEAAERFPEITIIADDLYLRDGKIFTTAGVTAGIDMALALIEDDLGPSAALEVARRLVVFVRRPGDQRQYSSALQRQAKASGEFADLAAWIADNVAGDLSSETLAERVGLSERQFRRRFSETFGETPTRHIERMRIEAASGWLANETRAIEEIALDAGFASADSFRRSFERLRGVTPSEYRHRFSGAAS